jgi:cobalt-zinc-cadmium efflux system protein
MPRNQHILTISLFNLTISNVKMNVVHDHAECDHHKPASYNWAFALGITLNLSFVIGETIFGAANRSLSLLADAGHNLGDVLGLLMGWIATIIALRPATERRTYGYRKSTILAAFGNSTLLLIGVGAVAWEAIRRLGDPVQVPGNTIMIVAAIGILVNGGTALAFVKGRKDDLNLEGAYLHMMTDAIVAFGVVVAGFAMRATGLYWIDPVMGLVIAFIVAAGSWKLLRRSAEMAIDAVPEKLDPATVRLFLEALECVEAVTDLHIWSLSTTEVALTAHLVVPLNAPVDFAESVSHDLHNRFGIDHSTIQLDQVARPCALTV